MMKFREKAIVIDAIQWTGMGVLEGIKEFLGDAFFCWHMHSNNISITVPGGFLTARLGDWIIKNAAGEFSLCNPDTFVRTYEEIDSLEKDLLKIATSCIDSERRVGYPTMASVLVDQIMPFVLSRVTPKEEKLQIDE